MCGRCNSRQYLCKASLEIEWISCSMAAIKSSFTYGFDLMCGFESLSLAAEHSRMCRDRRTVAVCCVLSRIRVFDPVFMRSHVNIEVYLNPLRKEFLPYLVSYGMDMNIALFYKEVPSLIYITLC